MEQSKHEDAMGRAEVDTKLWGLLRHRNCLVPTWRGWASLLLVFIAVGILTILGIHPFLAVSNPLPSGALAVEGWSPDYALVAALEEFKTGKYSKLFITGGPVEVGAPLSEYKTYAERGAAILLKLGLSPEALQAVPAPPVIHDRTYASAAALGQWWRDHGTKVPRMTLVTVGPHARRSRLIFEKALGTGTTVGVLPVPGRDYDPSQWWHSSQGVRTVMSEAIAYTYARLFFRAD